MYAFVFSASRLRWTVGMAAQIFLMCACRFVWIAGGRLRQKEGRARVMLMMNGLGVWRQIDGQRNEGGWKENAAKKIRVEWGLDDAFWKMAQQIDSKPQKKMKSINAYTFNPFPFVFYNAFLRLWVEGGQQQRINPVHPRSN